MVVGEHGLDELLDGLLGVEADDHVCEGGVEADVVEHDAVGLGFPQEELCVGAVFVGRGWRRHSGGQAADILSLVPFGGRPNRKPHNLAALVDVGLARVHQPINDGEFSHRGCGQASLRGSAW